MTLLRRLHDALDDGRAEVWPRQDFHFVPFLSAEQGLCYRCITMDNAVADIAFRLADGELKCFAITREIAHLHSVADR